MARRKAHAKTIYLVRRDNLPTIDFVLRDNERAANGYYLDPQDPETWRPVDTTGKMLTGWFRAMCGNHEILFGIPVLRHAPFAEGRCTLLGSPSTLMNIAPGWYEVEIEVQECYYSYKQTVWKRFKFCIRDDFDRPETDGMIPPIYRDENGDLKEIPVVPPECIDPNDQVCVNVMYSTTGYRYSGTAADPDGEISRVEWRLNGGDWQLAEGTASWTFWVEGLLVGENLVEVRSVDNVGACSVIHSCCITRGQNYKPTIQITDGCIDDSAPESPSECFADARRAASYGGTQEVPNDPVSTARHRSYVSRRQPL